MLAAPLAADGPDICPSPTARLIFRTVFLGVSSRTVTTDMQGDEFVQSLAVEKAVECRQNPSRQSLIPDTLAMASIPKFQALGARCSAAGVAALE
ncbi:MAG: hypothetical protein BMS9Abin10_0729 [Gammaproteobacteria bacterium]|nr:MAG: hypothetical protein BMS9Abin10_0729 [Gammaproteobacteria bacterium]